MSNEKLIKGLKKIIKRLKNLDDKTLDMNSYCHCVLSTSKLWKGDLMTKYNHTKTAKKLFGIKNRGSTKFFSMKNASIESCDELDRNEKMVIKLFAVDYNYLNKSNDLLIKDLLVKDWVKDAKKVIKKLKK